MIKGTTPLHIFNVPIEASVISNVEITYSQADEVILKKGVSECLIEDNRIAVVLSQEDTLKFNHKRRVQIQLRVKTVDDKVLSSSVIQREIEQCLSGEVLV